MGEKSAGTHSAGHRQQRRAAARAQPHRTASWLGLPAGRRETETKSAADPERCVRGGEADMSRPTGSAGDGGCAAPSRLRLHLGRAGGGGGGSSSRAS